MTPADVGTAAGRSDARPISFSARAGFGPRVILRARASAAMTRRAADALRGGQQAAQALAGQEDEVVHPAGRQRPQPGLDRR